MPLTTSTRLGPYEILAPLGAGGMGEVYRARDTRLGREVAVKVLPDHHTSSPEVRSRFEREARTVSSLNHPHICTLHDVGREGDTDYLVMELIEGETLAQRLGKGPLPLNDVLRIGAQMADALERAHRAGVIHRDLKPGNIMLTRSGAKLMDFGLARDAGLAQPPSSGGVALTQSPTMAQPLTAEGMIVGTFQYMAPEQLEGREADARSDIWSLGCVLYEMVTGRRAFDGATQASLISAIMRDEPRAVTALAPTSPPGLERLILQCLAKDPDDRWQSAGDVRRELEWIRTGTSQSAAIPAVPRRATARFPSWVWLAVVAAIGAAGWGLALGPWRDHGTHAPLVRFDIPSPPDVVMGAPAEAEISPDGRTVVFTAGDSLGNTHLFLRPFDSPDARQLAGTDQAGLPFWSPDGRRIGFFADGKLKKIALDGSPPAVICDAPDPRGGAWSPSQTIVFAPNNQGGLFQVPASGGTPKALTQLDASRRERGHRYPQFLPDGRHFLFVAIAQSEDVATFAGSLDGGKPVEVCRAGSMARFAPPDHVVFLDSGVNSRQRRVMAQRFDPGSRRVSGEPQLVLDRVNATNFGYPNLSPDAAGTLVVQHWSDPHSRLIWRDRQGRNLGVVAEDLASIGGAMSPDWRQMALAGPTGQDLYLRDMSSGATRRVTFENQDVGNCIWSPDGRSIAFSRLFGARGWQLRLKSLDSGQDSSVFADQGLFNFAQAWSRDGQWLVVLRVDSTSTADLWKVPMTGGGHAEVYQRTRGKDLSASLSPDGRWIAYLVLEDEKRVIYVNTFPTPGNPIQVAFDDPVGMVWSRKDNRLGVANSKGELYAIEVSTEHGFQQGAATRLFAIGRNETVVDVEPGGQRFLISVLKDAPALTHLEVLLNWQQMLEKR